LARFLPTQISVACEIEVKNEEKEEEEVEKKKN
jgi:hypothetical protein